LITLRKFCPVLLLLAAPLFSGDAPKLTFDQMEAFLHDGQIVSIKGISTGVTSSRRAKLTHGAVEHDAHVQCIDESKATFQGSQGTELNFRDTWKYNVAGYRLGRTLGLDMIPVSVERKIEGKNCAVTWWIDNSMMEIDRVKKKLNSPHLDEWNREMHIVRVFDQLIYNTDRNLQNLLIDPEWRIWMIDHTRAFRLYTTLKEKKNLVRCDRKLLENLRALDTEKLSTLKPYVTDQEIKGVLGRRNLIVKFFEDQIKEKGEAAVLYDRPER
jgi:hypothetical protein